eukprot:TRINITY_DN21678_c0_g1_i1.p1 TRINITY_DN21678_c0_g1~~TRINITY_DN21678_c0_g1_i1.p1  ORF type:complete len:211 (-),score=27.69 TRINITY_DN21678_c0_g1_i1:111-743(-)
MAVSSWSDINIKLQITYGLLGIFAIILALPVDFPFKENHTHAPRYRSDDHDVCRAHGWMFLLFMAWYASLVVHIIRSRHAMQQAWAVRLLIYPNLIVGILGFSAMIALYGTYVRHSEEGYTTTMGLLNGGLLAVITVFSVVIAMNPLAENLKYGWNTLAFSTGVFLFLNIALSAYESQWYLAIISGLILAPFTLGMLELSSKATKEPYKF